MPRSNPWRWTGATLAALLAAGCATRPVPAPRDGPDPNPPPDLHRVPDPIPRIEPIRAGGPNKPYEVFGIAYVPITADRPFNERGLASWYGRKFHGRPTASGEIYNMYAMTAAHPTLPIPSYVRVRNPANGREVIVRVNDRGPFHRGRVIDLSYTAALKLDLLRGVAPVEIWRLTYQEIQSGAWRRDVVPDAPAVAADAPAPDAAPTPIETARGPSAAPTAAGSRLLGAARRVSRTRRRRHVPAARRRRARLAVRRCWRSSRSGRCIACRPAPTNRATRPSRRPSASASRCSWCRWSSSVARSRRLLATLR